MWIHNLSPTLLSIGPLEIRWYSLVYVFGALFSLWWMLKLQEKGELQISKDNVWDFILYCLIGILIGARAFMLIWDPLTYIHNPIKLLYVWQGGMSFHGGLVGIILSGYLFCRKHKISFLKMADLMSFPTMLALALGRVANFINAELVGRAFDGEWCVVFPIDDNCRHPSTLYAATKRFILAGWLYFLTIKKFTTSFKTGFIFWNFIFFEGLGRFLIDYFREDILYMGLSTGQWMSLVMVGISGIVLIKYYKEDLLKIIVLKK